MDKGTMPSQIGPRLIEIGRLHLKRYEPLLAAADAQGTVSLASRLLCAGCAGLAALGLEAYRALGGRDMPADVGTAGAMLALLTKVDDQVIDSADSR